MRFFLVGMLEVVCGSYSRFGVRVGTWATLTAEKLCAYSIPTLYPNLTMYILLEKSLTPIYLPIMMD